VILKNLFLRKLISLLFVLLQIRKTFVRNNFSLKLQTKKILKGSFKMRRTYARTHTRTHTYNML